jgi:hypothetical protein
MPFKLIQNMVKKRQQNHEMSLSETSIPLTICFLLFTESICWFLYSFFVIHLFIFIFLMYFIQIQQVFLFSYYESSHIQPWACIIGWIHQMHLHLSIWNKIAEMDIISSSSWKNQVKARKLLVKILTLQPCSRTEDCWIWIIFIWH